jgi:HK97 family phage major capsid protein
MGPIQVLRAEDAELGVELAAIRAAAATGNRNLRAAERQRVEQIGARRDAIRTELLPLEAERAEILAAPVEGTERAVLTNLARLQANDGPSGRRYADLFGQPRTTTAGSSWKSVDEFFAVLGSGLADPRLMAAMGETVGSSGGFLVPEQFTAELLDASLEDEIVRPRARVIPMTTETMKAPYWDNSDHSSGALYGGITPRWLGESSALTEDTPKLALREFHAHKLGVYAKSSNELRDDGYQFDQQISAAFVGSLAWGLDSAFLTGNGTAKPLGILNDAAIITVAKETGQAADTIVYENLVKMFARLHPRSVNKAVWIANSSTIPQLLTLTMAVGTGGVTIPVLSETSGSYSMLTRPVLFTEKVPSLGDSGDIVLADLSQYTIGMRKDAEIEKSVHVGFATDETAYRGILRADGAGSWKTSFTPDNGDTLSWVVKLAARA